MVVISFPLVLNEYQRLISNIPYGYVCTHHAELMVKGIHYLCPTTNGSPTGIRRSARILFLFFPPFSCYCKSAFYTVAESRTTAPPTSRCWSRAPLRSRQTFDRREAFFFFSVIRNFLSEKAAIICALFVVYWRAGPRAYVIKNLFSQNVNA